MPTLVQKCRPLILASIIGANLYCDITLKRAYQRKCRKSERALIIVQLNENLMHLQSPGTNGEEEG